MDFHEKLQELRKRRGLTQEELADALYVSRTAVSKWESGRGYPSIDSLKELSAYFSVSIDDLLSGEKLILIAEKENKTNIQTICALLSGITDLSSIMLILLPLYPKTVDQYVYSVTLWRYTETAAYNRWIYWILFLSLIAIGIWQILQAQLKNETKHSTVTAISFALSIVTVFCLVLTGETYAAAVAIFLTIVKILLTFRRIQSRC